MLKLRYVVARGILAMGILGFVNESWAQTKLPNLALKKVATASSSEDSNPPQNAVDGNSETRWCSGDESPDAWWQIDLGNPQELGGCEISFEHDGAIYKYIIEGSSNGKTWSILNDQRGSTCAAQRQKLLFVGDVLGDGNKGAGRIRYVRIKFTALEDNSWASFFEFKIFDAESIKKLAPEEAKSYLPSAPIKVTSNTPTLAAPH